VKILAVSDLHPDHVTHGVPRFSDVQRALDQAVEVALRERVDYFVFLGDLCDPDSGPVVFRAQEILTDAAIMLALEGVKVHLLAGNHDVTNTGLGTTSLTPLRPLARLCVEADDGRVGSVRVHESPAIVDCGSHWFLMLPYVETARNYNPEEWIDALFSIENGFGPADGSSIVVCSHLSVHGIVPGEETTDMPRGRDVWFPHARFPDVMEERWRVTLLQGHYHRRQVFRSDGLCPIHVVGSPARLTFNEERNEPCFLILEIT
jgi:DNA repair exonuclease SbcCD nuclease subunit